MPIPLDLSPYEALVVGRLKEVLTNFARSVQQVRADESTTADHKRETVGRLRREAESAAADTLREIRQRFDEDRQSRPGAPARSADEWAEAQYWAIRADQEIRDLRPDEAVTRFAQIVQEGTPTAIAEFGRVVQAKASLDPQAAAQFSELRRASMPETERDAETRRAGLGYLERSIEILPGHVTQVLDNFEVDDAETRFDLWLQRTRKELETIGGSGE